MPATGTRARPSKSLPPKVIELIGDLLNEPDRLRA